jgi:polysaccharide chain length determinant protein (PEP-CTERM system associated)
MARDFQGGFAAEPSGPALTGAELGRFLEAPLRRRRTVLLSWAAVVALSLLALFLLPRKYRSSTLIFVESAKVPDSFVARVATEDRSARLDAMMPEILSRTRLERVLDETRPYPDIDSRTRAVEQLRLATSVELSGSDAFTIAFDHSDPRKAQQVTGRIATLFIEETIKSREEQVEGAVDFLVTQVNAARAELETKDEDLKRYKQAHMGRLPEQLQTNLATMGMLQRELQAVEESLLFARERQDVITGGAGRANAAAPGGTAGDDAGGVAGLRRQLAALRGRYTDEHPDVQRLKARIARQEKHLREATSGSGEEPEPPTAATRARLQATNMEITRLEAKRQELERRVAALRANVEETPRTEQELATMTRDYQKLNENYAALFRKQLDAQMSGRLEQRWKGDRFRILDPASLPEKPYSPKPLLVLGLGALLGLVAGLGAAVAAEALDTTVKDVADLKSLEACPVLACLPHVASLGQSARS